jgi:hypothetical protein
MTGTSLRRVPQVTGGDMGCRQSPRSRAAGSRCREPGVRLGTWIGRIEHRRDGADPAWNLSYAANDARRIEGALKERLAALGEFDVRPVRLVIDAESSPEEAAGTREHLRAVLDRLAGRAADPAAIQRIPGAAALERAQPEDLVIISISSPGFTDQAGAFHSILAGIGPVMPPSLHLS